MAGLSAVARMHDPQAVVWRGDQGLPTAQQGLKVLGGTSGHPDFIRSFLSQKGLEHDHLLEMISQVPDVHCMVVAGVLRIHSSEFLEDSGSRIHPRVC